MCFILIVTYLQYLRLVVCMFDTKCGEFERNNKNNNS